MSTLRMPTAVPELRKKWQPLDAGGGQAPVVDARQDTAGQIAEPARNSHHLLGDRHGPSVGLRAPPWPWTPAAGRVRAGSSRGV
jgi:hypothetical protein